MIIFVLMSYEAYFPKLSKSQRSLFKFECKMNIPVHASFQEYRYQLPNLDST